MVPNQRMLSSVALFAAATLCATSCGGESLPEELKASQSAEDLLPPSEDGLPLNLIENSTRLLFQNDKNAFYVGVPQDGLEDEVCLVILENSEFLGAGCSRGQFLTVSLPRLDAFYAMTEGGMGPDGYEEITDSLFVRGL